MINIHKTSEVKTTKIGDNTHIWQFCVVLENASIGENCNINFNCFIENDVIIGNNVTVKSGVYIWDGIRIEDNVFIGPNVTFVNNPYPRSKQYPSAHIGCTIKNSASIGANSTLMGNITIGEYALIGAGSVLTKDVGNSELWYGNPARHKGFVSAEGEVLDLSLMDKKKRKYKWQDNKLIL